MRQHHTLSLTPCNKIANRGRYLRPQTIELIMRRMGEDGQPWLYSCEYHTERFSAWTRVSTGFSKHADKLIPFLLRI
jgi:hypothetical protein